MSCFYAFLDEHVFPRVIAYTTHRVHISLLMVLWLGLLLGGSFTAFELVGGNYTNGLSALASCIVLLQQLKHHREVKHLHAQHTADVAALHAKIEALATAPGVQAAPAASSVTRPRTRRKVAGAPVSDSQN